MRTMTCGDTCAKNSFSEVPLKGSSKSQTERDLSQHNMKTKSFLKHLLLRFFFFHLDFIQKYKKSEINLTKN